VLLVTVGTYKFDAMVRSVENVCNQMSLDVHYQIGVGDASPSNGRSERFLSEEKFNELAESASVIITHAGAGTVYKFLEKRYRLIVVPNFERTDDHQQDICDYLLKNNYAFVCFDLSSIKHAIIDSLNNDLKLAEYKKTNFFETGEILGYFDSF
jgi:beta-1,4-N-acetylglucosaminyltransferase